MYPNLYYAFKDLFGVAPEFLKMFQSFGFFVALAFLAAGYFFSQELKRKEAEKLVFARQAELTDAGEISLLDYIGNALLGFLLGFKLIFIAFNFGLFLENTQQLILSLKGSLPGGIGIAALMVFLKYREGAGRKKNANAHPATLVVHPYQHVGNMTSVAAIAGLLGAKIFHNLENWGDFMADPIGSLLSFSGLTMYGGLIFGSLAVIYYAKKHGIATLPLIDACAPGLMLAYGVGRIGCQVAGDGDWGIDNLQPKPSWLSFLPDSFWAFRYAHNVNEVGIGIPGCIGKYCTQLPNPVFPTPLYESIACILLFFVLWGVRKKITQPGSLFSLYLVFNGFERFLIEKIRINTLYHIFGRGITQAEIISSILFLLGVMGLVYFNKQKKLGNAIGGDL